LIDFTGGEPLLNKELPEMLQTAKENGFFVNLSTNCLLYPEKADEIKGNVDHLYFSLDTTSRQDYQKIRGSDGFYKVMESIDIAKALDQNVCLLYTVTNENITNIAELVEFSRKNKVMLYIKPCFSYFGNDALIEEHIKTIKKYFWKPYVRMSLTHMNFHYHGGNSTSNPRCKTGKATFDISPDNCVLIPCFQNQQQKLPLNGNLFSVYNSSRWNEAFSNVGRYPFCEHCSIECNFGLSYWNRLSENFFLQNLSFLKYAMVHRTIRNDETKRNNERRKRI
jgi:MoaA/NifB/PqqE/SkfB family radical SAM enzyme